MGSLDQNHILKIEKYLDEQGLTFKPLREEMFDHLLSDLQEYMEQGKSFEEAWTMISGSIPPQHFKTLQTETMETLNTRFNISKVFTYLTLLLLAITSFFKLLHLQGTGYLLITSLVAIGVALLVSSLSGIYLYKEKKGRWLMVGTISGIMVFITSWVFKILSLPAGNELLIGSVIILVILFPVLTLYFNSPLRTENNILTYLHEKHIPGIERFLIILLVLATVLRIPSIIFHYMPSVSGALLILVICGAGLQYFALTWHPQTLKQVSSGKWGQALLIIAFICFILPALGSHLSLPLRITMGTGFFVIAGLLAVVGLPKNSKKVYSAILLGIIIVFHIGWWLIQMKFLDTGHLSLLFNLPFILVVISGILFSGKYSLMRVYLIIVMAHYFLEYPVNLGLW